MTPCHRLPAFAMLVLYLQAAFVLSSVSIIVTDDGTVQIESATEHLVRWHGTTCRSDFRNAHLDDDSDRSTSGTPGHSHLKATDSAVGAGFGRGNTSALSAPAAHSPARSLLFEIAVSFEPFCFAGSAPEPIVRFAAAEAAFAHLQLLV